MKISGSTVSSFWMEEGREGVHIRPYIVSSLVKTGTIVTVVEEFPVVVVQGSPPPQPPS